MNVSTKIVWSFNSSSYFCGASASFSGYDNVMVGCGSTLRSAISDALEMIGSVDGDLADKIESSKALYEVFCSLRADGDFHRAHIISENHNRDISEGGDDVYHDDHYFYVELYYSVASDELYEHALDVPNYC